MGIDSHCWSVYTFSIYIHLLLLDTNLFSAHSRAEKIHWPCCSNPFWRGLSFHWYDPNNIHLIYSTSNQSERWTRGEFPPPSMLCLRRFDRGTSAVSHITITHNSHCSTNSFSKLSHLVCICAVKLGGKCSGTAPYQLLSLDGLYQLSSCRQM